MRHGVRQAAWLMAACSLAPMASAEEPTDWPATIARLRQDVYDRPGFAPPRQQLAIAYNNYGVSLGNQQDWNHAIEQLQEAIHLAPDDQKFKDNLSTIYVNQASEAYDHHQVTEARTALEKAMALTPNLPQAYALLGEIAYGAQQLKEAKAAWQRSLALNANQPGVQEKLDRVSQELPVESKFDRTGQAYFDLRYEERVQQTPGFDVRDALIEARREIGSDFAYWPKQKFIVLLYSADTFRALRQETPDWVGGQFDGKIRVPLPGGRMEPSAVKEILCHEYTHALIHDLTNDQCPLCLNEGLAGYEGRKRLRTPVAQLAAAVREKRLIPWNALSDQFTALPSAEEVALAYQQAESIVAYLVNRYGFWKIRRVLKAINDGAAWDATFVDEYHVKLTRLETDWKAWLSQWLSDIPSR